MKKVSITLMVLVLVMVTLLAGCKKKEDIEYYSDYEPPSTSDTQKSSSTSNNFDFDSLIEYDLSDQIAAAVDPKAFDRGLVSYLKMVDRLPDIEAFGVMQVTDAGYLTYYYDEGAYQFEVILADDSETHVLCTKTSDKEYHFAIGEDEEGYITYNREY